jgi:hypothetical protein
LNAVGVVVSDGAFANDDRDAPAALTASGRTLLRTCRAHGCASGSNLTLTDFLFADCSGARDGAAGGAATTATAAFVGQNGHWRVRSDRVVGAGKAWQPHRGLPVVHPAGRALRAHREGAAAAGRGDATATGVDVAVANGRQAMRAARRDARAVNGPRLQVPTAVNNPVTVSVAAEHFLLKGRNG